MKRDSRYIDYCEPRLMDNEGRCALMYIRLGELEQAKIHLIKASQLLVKDDFIPYYQHYHSTWAEYYRAKQNWKLCFKEMNLAFAKKNADEPWYEQSLRVLRARYHWEAGYKKEALALYDSALIYGNSIIRATRDEQAKVVRENYMIKQQLMRKATIKGQRQLYVLIFSFLLLAVIGFMVFKILQANRILLKAKRKTQEADDLAKKAKRMKEVFIENIINDIHKPLDNVVSLSKEISVNRQELSKEQKETYAKDIKFNSDHLIVLVNSVLDLSRLESGMMKFNNTDVEVVQLLRDAISSEALHHHDGHRIWFETDVESFVIHIDQNRMLNLFSSVLIPQDEEMLTCDMRMGKTGSKIILEIKGSALASKQLTRLQEIQNEINRLFVTTFGGEYSIINKTITISL
jgi:signal transduction histidine kinase